MRRQQMLELEQIVLDPDRCCIPASPAFDAEVVASGVLVSHFDVIHIPEFQQFLNRNVVVAAIDLAPGNEALAFRVGFENSRVLPEIVRIARIFRVTLAGLGVDVDGSRQRNLFDAVKWIVSEESSLFCADMERAQAMAARTVSASHLCVRWESIAR